MITRDFNLVIRVPQQNYIETGVEVVQGDQNVYTLNLRITDGIIDIDYAQINSATITFAKADGKVVQGDLVATGAGFTYEMGTNEIAYPGKVIASIQLYGDIDERLTTARFSFKVVQDLITPVAVQSTSEFPLLQKLLQDIEQLKTDIVNLEVSDGTLLDVKLSDAAGQIKDKVTTLQNEVTVHKTDLASQSTGKGASLIGIEDADENFTATNVEGALAEVKTEVESHKADIVTDVDGAHGFKIEEGTFTPFFYGSTTPGSPTHLARQGYYKMINDVCCFDVYIVASNTSGMQGNVRIGGLPKASVNQTDRMASCSVGLLQKINYPEGYNTITCYVRRNEASLSLIFCGDSVDLIGIQPENLFQSALFRISGTYKTV